MPTVNEVLFDESVKHALYLERYTKRELIKALSVLEKASEDIIAKIQNTKGEYTRNWLQSVESNIKSIIGEAQQQLSDRFGVVAKDIADYEAERAPNVLQKAIPVAVSVTVPSPSILYGAIKNRPADRGNTLQELLDNWKKTQQTKIVAAVRQGMVEGEAINQLMQRIRGTRKFGYKDGVLQNARRSAEALVRTAVNHASNESLSSIYKANDDFIKEVQWSATLDASTCIVCADLDGTVYSMDEGPRPPAHANCRCVIVPVVKSAKELGLDLPELPEATRASMNGQVADSVTYSEWLARQSASVQKDVLGAKRADMFSKGMKLDDMTDKGKVLTLAQLKELEKK